MTMAGKLVFRTHAIQRMFERGITEGDVKDTMTNGIIIEVTPAVNSRHETSPHAAARLT